MDRVPSPLILEALHSLDRLDPNQQREFYQWVMRLRQEPGLLPPLAAPGANGYSTGDGPVSDPLLGVHSWDTFTLADAYQERPPVRYVVAGLLPESSLTIVYGPPGSLKSFWMASVAVCVAAGLPCLPPAQWLKEADVRAADVRAADGLAPDTFPVNQSPVVWVDFDNGRRRTHDRFAALGRALKLPPDTPLYYHSMPSPWLDASDPLHISELEARLRLLQARLVVIDNLGVVSGQAEENSGDMVAVMSNFRQLAERSGAAVVLIHHQRKSTGGIGRAGDALRGHSSIEAALDLALMVEREEQSDTIHIKATKVRGPDVAPFTAMFTFDRGEDGELRLARFFRMLTDDNSSAASLEREILAVLAEAPLNKKKLVTAVHARLDGVPGVNRIRDYIARLVSQGKIIESHGSKSFTERVYSLPKKGQESES